ncbi:MAG: toll/interleukin-1 receptor domain-containing protein, partial [Clostridia bacterium]|nr:toll/interleukin-1 receptor domain-containing protein [Clostridia bacterium]
MERLKFKTRGMRSPQGIPRVFFCGHPKDFDRLFESVSDEILAKQNCAVFYDSTPDAERDEQFYLDLKQMQLFVIPVTSELLYIENTALSELFPFAIENHIPVLPIMQESGLDKVFNEKCGDLQYLDKTSTDITAISYDEKLEKYLSSVLIGDEMAEKICNAFDAYVFLSYRKKDRKYAQELMKLIHKNDFCRDIAIWYDEFLTPGENFNDSIKAAFEKSGLFVLAVTPNLVNEVNYVMTTEYPMAREAGKPILPAELVETDKSLLAEKYEGIPD